jgi:hypothetical protein
MYHNMIDNKEFKPVHCSPKNCLHNKLKHPVIVRDGYQE